MISIFTVMPAIHNCKSTSTLLSSILAACLHDTQIFMTNIYLKFNTELLITGTKASLSKTKSCSLFIAEAFLLSWTVFSLFSSQSPGLPLSTCEISGSTKHSTEVDSCNAILAGIPNKRLHQFQLIQNSTAQIITHSKTN